MLQIVQSAKSGELELRQVPPPALLPGGVLVRTCASLISAGTEKMVIDQAQKSLISRVRERPDLARQVISKIRAHGVSNTIQSVVSKLEQGTPLGYSAAGIVHEVGEQVRGLKVGDRIALAGTQYANHAELNYAPVNLTALVPDSVSFEEAAYTTVASIAMQGVRLARPELGEFVVVSGLGLIGLITVQILKANGCRVLGIDFTKDKVELGLKLGLDDAVLLPVDDAHRGVDRFSKGRGADVTLITAATNSNQPIELAGEITRRKGRIVVVGAVGLNIPRDIYYRKELDLQISMSYGPGRYDSSYEEGGLDYPYDYVRWTEQRNMEAVLELMAGGRLDVRTLTTHTFPFEQAPAAYELIKTGSEPYVGIVLKYDPGKEQEKTVQTGPATTHASKEQLGIGFVGAGNYASVHLLPHLKKLGDVQLRGLVSATGLSAKQKAGKFGFAYCGTDIAALLEDAAIDAVFIGTRHGTHAEFTIRALGAGKHVFVEKPMVVDEEQLEAVKDAYLRANEKQPTGLMVGLNRRFSPLVGKLKEAFKAGGAMQMTYRVNSGQIPTSTWLHEPQEGGGMLVGEMCHFVDLMQFICGEVPRTVYASALTLDNQKYADGDNLVIVISFDGGSVGTLCYNTIGSKAFPKERLEVYGGGTVAVLNDFRSLEVMHGDKRSQIKSASQDKGQERQVEETIKGFRTSGSAPIPFDQLLMGMRVIFAARRSSLSGQTVDLTSGP